MKIGILGSGDVGQALGIGLAKHGHDVLVGSREPAKLEGWRKGAKGKVATGTFADAAKHGEIVILATSGRGVENAVDLAGASHFAGKLVLDATNPLDFSQGLPPTNFTGANDSLAERVQKKLPAAHVVKCFNTVSSIQMIDPKFREGVPPMLVAGNDAHAKKRAEALLRQVGWPGITDCGDLAGARGLEALVPLWVRVAEGEWGHAFKVVR